jgi:ribosomal protein S18 acetylase RimI-like enzyme
MKCHYCCKDAVFKCGSCGQFLCGQHAHLRTVCSECVKKSKIDYTIDRTTSEEKKREIGRFVERFWGEEEQLTFGRKFKVAELPAYVARIEESVIGFISIVDVDDAVLIVVLGVLPQYQSAGVGKRLVEKVEGEAVRRRKKRLLVSTSNDDLPALAFYQSVGFRICEVKPDVIARKHGEVLRGIGDLPIRDELRLQKRLE